MINNFLPFVLLKTIPFRTIFSKLYLFQSRQSHPYVCKKDLQWSPVEVEKMDNNQFHDSVESELMSISEFMQEAQKRQKNVSIKFLLLKILLKTFASIYHIVSCMIFSTRVYSCSQIFHISDCWIIYLSTP